MGKHSSYRQIINVLERLHKTHPTYNMGRHLATALDDSDIWGVTDRELLMALKKYETSLNLDNHVNNEEEIEEIVKNGINLERMFLDEEEE
jgi:hypothetical protein